MDGPQNGRTRQSGRPSNVKVAKEPLINEELNSWFICIEGLRHCFHSFNWRYPSFGEPADISHFRNDFKKFAPRFDYEMTPLNELSLI